MIKRLTLLLYALAAYGQVQILPSNAGQSKAVIDSNFGWLNTNKAALAHVHLISDVTGLQAALDSKAAANHQHSGIYEPVDATLLRQANLSGSGTAVTPAKSDHDHSGMYAAVSHTHGVSDISSGVFPMSRLAGGGSCDSSTFLRGDGQCAAPPGGGGGEANTASNTGTAGVGFFKAKVGADLAFYKLNPASNQMSISLNGTDRVDIDIVPGNIPHQALSGSGVNTHAQIDTHIAAVNNPHSTTAAQVGAPAAALLNTLGDVVYRDASGWARLAGNTLSAKRLFCQTGTGAVSAAPSWCALVAGDIPDISATYQAITGKGSVNGYASLDSGAKVPIGQLPTGTTSLSVSLGNHLHAGIYEPVDATILRQGNLAGSGSATTAAKSDHTHNGTYAPDAGNQSGRKVLASPSDGSSGAMAPRALVPADVPDVSATYQVITGKGVANGYASLDAEIKIPFAQLPTGQTSSTIAVGNDARFSDARTPISHAASHRNGGADEIATVTPGANAIPKAAAGGTLAAEWIPTLNQSTSGNAATATNFDHTPSKCSAGSYPLGVDAHGDAQNCTAAPGGGGGGGTGNAPNAVTTTFSTAPALNCGSASAGTVTNFQLSTALTANIAPTVTNCTPGQIINIHLVQDGQGNRTWTAPANWDPSNIDPRPNAATDLEYVYLADGTSTRLNAANPKGPGFVFMGPEMATPTVSQVCPTGQGAGYFDSSSHLASFCNNNSATISHPWALGTGLTNSGPTASVNTTLIAQKFFGTAAPGSVAGNLPGDLFTDTTNHHEYVCNAPSGTAAPACTSVTAAGWLQIDNTTAPAMLVNHGTSRTVTAQSEIYVCTSTCTVTPLTPSEGTQLCVQNDDNVSTVITLAAIASVQYEGTPRTAYGTANHTFTSGGAVKDQICIVGRDATHYNVWSSVGTWTLN